jgi:hypothetical protein
MMSKASQSEFVITANDPDHLLAVLASTKIMVLPRTQGRDKFQTERWAICRLLATFAKSADLTFPLRLIQRDKPDFVVETPGGRIGIEVTEAVSEQFAHYMAIAEREFPTAILEPAHFRWGAPKLSDKRIREFLSQARLTSSGWVGEEAEVEWAAAIDAILRRKIESLRKKDFEKYELNWLVIYDNLPLPDIDFGRATPNARALIHGVWNIEPAFDALFVEAGDSVVRMTPSAAREVPLNDLWAKREANI